MMVTTGKIPAAALRLLAAAAALNNPGRGPQGVEYETV